MRVFWFVNVPFPAVRTRLGIRPSGSGFWLVTLAEELVRHGVELTVAICHPRSRSICEWVDRGIRHIVVPARSAQVAGVAGMALGKRLAELVSADYALVDVHGTEYAYGLVTPWLRQPVVVTVQGFVSAVARAPFGSRSIVRGLLGMLAEGVGSQIPALLRWLLVTQQRARNERRVLTLNTNFIGRTQWDRVTLERQCPRIKKYYKANRILRPSFYHTEWRKSPATAPVVFACARPAPYKGFDDLISAAVLLRERFPNIEMKITARENGSPWERYLARLVQRAGLQQTVKFCGYLDESSVAAAMATASVYVHPSHVDNSPNSLAEAMCVGVPCVAASTGGIPSMVADGSTGLLYSPGSVSDLTESIARLLSDRALALRLSNAARQTARARHAPEAVVRATLDAYRDLLHSGS